jgi:TolB-like protein
MNKDSKLPVKVIAGELGVSAILEGSVRTSDNRVQVLVQLFHVRLDLHLWSEKYGLPDSPTVWSDIAQKITDEVNVYFIPE